MPNRFPYTCAALLYAAALAAVSILEAAGPDPRALVVAAPRVIDAGRYVYAPSHVTGSAIYSAVYIAAGTKRGGAERAGKFKADENLPPELQAKPADYARSGFDIGHLVEFAALSDDQAAAASTFNLSNGVPQSTTLNRGLWRMIEAEARDLADSPGASGVLIVNVPIYDFRRQKPQTIGAGHVFRPTHLAKVALVLRDGKPAALRAWIASNSTPLGTDPDHYRASVRQVEAATQLDLFPTLPDDVEARLESASEPGP